MNCRHQENKIYYYHALIWIEEQKEVSQSLFLSPYKIHHSVGFSAQFDVEIQLHVTYAMQQLPLEIDFVRRIT